MATLKNKRKLASLNKENCEDIRGATWHKIQKFPDYKSIDISQVSEEIQGSVTKKLSQEFSRTENCILGALSRLDDFLMNPMF